MIHLAFTLFQRDSSSPYPMALAALYASIRERTQEALSLHVIVDKSVEILTKRKLEASMKEGDCLCFYDAASMVESYRYSREFDGRFSPAIVWRIWIEHYLDIEKCILLDCDLLFNFDIKILWDVDLSRCPVSAPLRGVPHPLALHEGLSIPLYSYFRMCCVVLDLNAIRRDIDFQSRKVSVLCSANELFLSGVEQAGFLEQSVYNHFYSKTMVPFGIPVVPVDRLKGHPREREWREHIELNRDFIVDIKGWRSSSPFALLFWSSLLRTSWSSSLLEGIRLSNLFDALMSGKFII